MRAAEVAVQRQKESKPQDRTVAGHVYLSTFRLAACKSAAKIRHKGDWIKGYQDCGLDQGKDDGQGEMGKGSSFFFFLVD
jgi:hypothetical protein